jgi:hypothetical protein
MAGSNTIAFSTKTMNWTTEYSFSPDRFAYVGNQLVSFPRDTSNTAWLHDKSTSYNTFYGEEYPSEFQIVTNEDPSATKIYEAFSLEATDGNWSAEFRTETGEPQQSSFVAGTLVEKEGKHYIDIPKNSLDKTADLKFVGKTTLGEIVAADEMSGNASIALNGRVNSVPGAYLFFVLPNYYLTDSEGNLLLNNLGEATFDLEAADADGLGSQVLDYVNITSLDFLGVPLAYNQLDTETPFASELVPINDFESSPTNALPFGLQPKYNASTNSIEVGFFFNWASANESVFVFSGQPGIPSNSLSNLPVSIYTGSLSNELNGEDMRGEYMEVKLSRTGTDYYELYAINVDQHKTKLDHSLGQNN